MAEQFEDMICLVCGQTFSAVMKECPNCGTVIETTPVKISIPLENPASSSSGAKKSASGKKPAARKAAPQTHSRAVVSLSEMLQVLMDIANEYEKSGNLDGALETYRRALNFVEKNRGDDAFIQLAIQTLNMLIRRTEEVIATGIKSGSIRSGQAESVQQTVEIFPETAKKLEIAEESIKETDKQKKSIGSSIIEPPQTTSRTGELIAHPKALSPKRILPIWATVVIVIGCIAGIMGIGILGLSQIPLSPSQIKSTNTSQEAIPVKAPTITREAPASATPQPVTITWWHTSTTDAHKALFQQFADEYMAAHPNVTIKITVLEYEAFKTQLTTSMQSGEPPDIFQSWGDGVMNQLAEAGLLKDITADLDADGNAWRNSFATGALGVYSYKGVNYGVPWDMGMIGFWYNKDLFAQAGIANPPTTWTEFLDDVKALKAAGITPIALGEGDQWPGTFMWAYLVTRIGGKANFEGALLRTGSFTDAPFIQAGEKLQELLALEPFQDGFLDATYGDEATLMGNGQAAMELMGQWAPSLDAANSADGKGIGDKLGFFPFPMVGGGAGDINDAVGGGNGFAIGKNAPSEAVDFVKFMTNPENQAALAAIGVAIPVVKGGEIGLSDPLMIIVQSTSAKADYFQLYYDQALPPAMAYVIHNSTQGLFAGTLTPEECAQAIEDSAQQELK